MTRFETCLDFILDREGGFVNDPRDPGGATNKGITQRTYDAWRRGRGEPLRSVELIESAEVAAIYQSIYWTVPRCDQLPAPLDLIHFDTAVNNGVGTANRMLQTALSMQMIDGVIGDRTLAAVKLADPLVIAARYASLRLTRYIVISAGNEKRAFLKGWLRRVGHLLVAI